MVKKSKETEPKIEANNKVNNAKAVLKGFASLKKPFAVAEPRGEQSGGKEVEK